MNCGVENAAPPCAFCGADNAMPRNDAEAPPVDWGALDDDATALKDDADVTGRGAGDGGS